MVCMCALVVYKHDDLVLHHHLSIKSAEMLHLITLSKVKSNEGFDLPYSGIFRGGKFSWMLRLSLVRGKISWSSLAWTLCNTDLEILRVKFSWLASRSRKFYSTKNIRYMVCWCSTVVLKGRRISQECTTVTVV